MRFTVKGCNECQQRGKERRFSDEPVCMTWFPLLSLLVVALSMNELSFHGGDKL